jgi:hypothetical protein
MLVEIELEFSTEEHPEFGGHMDLTDERSQRRSVNNYVRELADEDALPFKLREGDSHIEKCLSLSTGHVNWDPVNDVEPLNVGGGLRVAVHEYGWVVFTNPGVDEKELGLWFRPIHTLALEEGATMVLFDRDIETSTDFHIYDW